VSGSWPKPACRPTILETIPCDQPASLTHFEADQEGRTRLHFHNHLAHHAAPPVGVAPVVERCPLHWRFSPGLPGLKGQGPSGSALSCVPNTARYGAPLVCLTKAYRCRLWRWSGCWAQNEQVLRCLFAATSLPRGGIGGRPATVSADQGKTEGEQGRKQAERWQILNEVLPILGVKTPFRAMVS